MKVVRVSITRADGEPGMVECSECGPVGVVFDDDTSIAARIHLTTVHQAQIEENND